MDLPATLNPNEVIDVEIDPSLFSRMAKYTAELRLHELELPQAEVIDIDVLKKENLVPAFVTKVKVIKSGEVNKAVKLKGIAVTKGAREAIEKAGGSIED